jgi:hypothetical protein
MGERQTAQESQCRDLQARPATRKVRTEFTPLSCGPSTKPSGGALEDQGMACGYRESCGQANRLGDRGGVRKMGGKVALPHPGNRSSPLMSKEVVAGSVPAIRLHKHRALRPGARGCLLFGQIFGKNSWRNPLWRDPGGQKLVEVRAESLGRWRSKRGGIGAVAQE